MEVNETYIAGGSEQYLFSQKITISVTNWVVCPVPHLSYKNRKPTDTEVR